MNLKAGKRFRLVDGERFAFIESGNMDEFEQTETLIYAVEDMQIKFYAMWVRRADKVVMAETLGGIRATIF